VPGEGLSTTLGLTQEDDQSVQLVRIERRGKRRHPTTALGDRESQEVVGLTSCVRAGAKWRSNHAFEIISVTVGAQLQVDLFPTRIFGRSTHTGGNQNEQQRKQDDSRPHR